jgi:hypothetical protein
MENKSKRGRPTLLTVEERPTKYTREYKSDDGSSEIWYFDSKITQNGPVSVEIKHAKKYKSFEEEQAELPLTKRQFFNKANGKYVGYARAKALGILK